MTRGQPLAIAASMCALMVGYFSLLKRKRCTVEGRLQPRALEARGAGAGGDGAAEALPLAHGHGRLSQIIFSRPEEGPRWRVQRADGMWLLGMATRVRSGELSVPFVLCSTASQWR